MAGSVCLLRNARAVFHRSVCGSLLAGVGGIHCLFDINIRIFAFVVNVAIRGAQNTAFLQRDDATAIVWPVFIISR